LPSAIREGAVESSLGRGASGDHQNGGSGGGSWKDHGALLAGHGFTCLSLACFNADFSRHRNSRLTKVLLPN